jgi:hypothetical protein
VVKTYELLLFIALSFLIKTLIHFRLLLTHQGLNGKEAPTCPRPPSSRPGTYTPVNKQTDK